MATERVKVTGPYAHGNKWRVLIDRGVVGAGGQRFYRSFAARSDADAFVAGARDQAQGRTVADAVEAWLKVKSDREREASTIASAEDRVSLLLAGMMQRPLRSIIGKGAELYAVAQVYPDSHRRAGERRAADTHRNALLVAREFGAFCVKQRWLKSNPFADVEPVGRKVVGKDKLRLSIDESRTLYRWCREHTDDQGAVLTLGYLLLGGRASELVDRNVGDLDDNGAIIWIGKTKTEAGRRALVLPEEYRPLMVGLAGDRDRSEPLFVSVESRKFPAGRRWSRYVAYYEVKRCCAAAGVTVVSPQGLRRTQATLATHVGETAVAVARQLGHEVAGAPAVTARAYVARGAGENAQVERSLRVIAGGKR